MSINLKRFNRINRKKIFNKLERVNRGAVPAKPKRPPLLHPQYDVECLTDIFLSKFSASAASFQSIDSLTLVPELIQLYAEQHGLTPTIATNVVDTLSEQEPNLQWPDTLTLHTAPASGTQPMGLSYARAGIAETGSLVLTSSATNPTSTNFLPDHHIIILNEKDIVPNIEMMWKSLSLSAGSMPRAVNIITGPSRTADIEQTLQLGAHGPRSVHVLLLTETLR